MGANLRLRTLHDLKRNGFHLGIECQGCDRKPVYGIQGIIDHFQSRKLNADLEAARSYFVCEKCGTRRPRLRPVAPYKVPDLPTLEPSRYELKERARRARG